MWSLLEEHRDPVPQRRQHPGVGPIDLLQDREQPALFMMVIQDQLGNVHGPLLSSTGMPSGSRR